MPTQIRNEGVGLGIRGQSSILNGVNILLLEFLFSRSKACDANISIIANIVCLLKTQMTHFYSHKKHNGKFKKETILYATINVQIEYLIGTVYS